MAYTKIVYLKFPEPEGFFKFAKEHSNFPTYAVIVKSEWRFHRRACYIRLTKLLSAMGFILVCDVTFFKGLEGEKTNDDLLQLEAEKLKQITEKAKEIFGKEPKPIDAEFTLEP